MQTWIPKLVVPFNFLATLMVPMAIAVASTS